MCGRFTLRTPQNLLVQQFMLFAAPDYVPRYNIAPTQEVVVIRQSESGREASLLRWGLIPSWAKDTKIAASLLNARAETVAEKPSFRSAFKSRRCLVPADGYYEWLRVGKARIPHLYELKNGEPFAFAGLWERWQELETFTILTTAANELAASVHDRMPVILSPEDYDPWLSPTTAREDLERRLDSFPATEMVEREVSTFVNNARHEGPECIASTA